MLHDGPSGEGINLATTYPNLTAPVEALDPIVGMAAAGRWILRVTDTDLLNAPPYHQWLGLNTRQADDARLPHNLVVDGAVESG